MKNCIGWGLVGGFSAAIGTAALIAGIVLSVNPPSDTSLGAKPRIQSLKGELPEEPSLTLPVNGN